MKPLVRGLLLAASFACAALPAAAASQSFTGNLTADADVRTFSFTVSQAAPVTLRTYSYAGGANAAGAPIPEGGFDPTISLFDGAGNLITGNRDGGCGTVAADSVTSFCWDAYLSLTLPAGTYTVALTQSENLANGPALTNSFVYAGQGNFTTPPGQAGGFWDLFPSRRTSFFALDVASDALLIPTSPIPALTFTTNGNLGGFVPNSTIAGNFGATGGVGPYTFTATGLPAGISLNGATGAYSGTGGNPGFYTFTVQVTDSEFPTVSTTQNVTYSVLGLTTTALPQGSTASVYAAGVSATGGTGTYGFTATGLPQGLVMSGAGAISGTPAAAGTYTVIVQVASGVLTWPTTFTLVVTSPAAQPLTVSAETLPAGAVAVPYSSATGLAATGGTPPYSWKVFGGVLPGGMSLSSSGVLQGTPVLAGTYGFTAQVTDSAGATATGIFSVVINSPGLTLTLGAFPAGVAQVAYPLQNLTVLASGGDPGYTFAVTGGNLPAGLIVQGQELSGTPTTAGTFNFTITVTDAAGKTASSGGTIVIVPAQTTLILSRATVPFSIIAGAGGVQQSASVTIRSSDVTQILNYATAVLPSAGWLDVSGGVTTPGALTIALDPTAPSLAASATPYTTNIVVTCAAPSPCAGNSQTIAVSLTVTAPAPQLTLSASLLAFSAFVSDPAVSSQNLVLQNAGGGTIDISSIVPGAGWLTVTGTPATLTAGPGASVVVTANPAGLSAGYYTTTLTVNTSAGNASIPVTLLVTQALTMTLEPAGFQYSAQTGSAPGNGDGSFNVSALGTGTLSWNAAVGPGADWLTLNTASGASSSAAAGTVSYTLNADVISALAPATYFATIAVTTSGASDNEQDYQVVLDITPATTPLNPVLSAAGLIFTSGPAGTTGPQNLLVYAGALGSVTRYQASAATTDGSSWLLVSPAKGGATQQAPALSTVSVSAAGLAPGVYSSGVSYAFSGDAVRTVNVTLLVLNAGPAPAERGVSAKASPTCAATQLIGTQTGLYNNFAQAAGWPTPISVNLIDNCGAAVNGAVLTTTFSNGDPPMALSPRDNNSGIYVGTWTPRNPAPQVTVTALATHAPFSPASTQVTGEVRTGVTPLLTPNATLDVFNPVVGAALAPGQVVQIYGSNLATQTVIAPAPLQTNLGGTTVLIGGIAAPLFYVSAGQIDAQIPFELTPGAQYQILVEVNGTLSTPMPIQIVPVAPNLANLSGQALAEHLDGSLISATSPAQPGEYVILYLSGMGATTNPVADGAITPSVPDPSMLSIPLAAPTVTLNGAVVPSVFDGLTPTAVGLYQIDFQMPADITAGNLQLFVTQGGVNSNTVIIPVQ